MNYEKCPRLSCKGLHCTAARTAPVMKQGLYHEDALQCLPCSTLKVFVVTLNVAKVPPLPLGETPKVPFCIILWRGLHSVGLNIRVVPQALIPEVAVHSHMADAYCVRLGFLPRDDEEPGDCGHFFFQHKPRLLTGVYLFNCCTRAHCAGTVASHRTQLERHIVPALISLSRAALGNAVSEKSWKACCILNVPALTLSLCVSPSLRCTGAQT